MKTNKELFRNREELQFTLNGLIRDGEIDFYWDEEKMCVVYALKNKKSIGGQLK